MTHVNEQYQHLKRFEDELPEWGRTFIAISKEMGASVFFLRAEHWKTRTGRTAPPGLWFGTPNHAIFDEDLSLIKGKTAAMDYLRAFYVFWIPMPPDFGGGSHE